MMLSVRRSGEPGGSTGRQRTRSRTHPPPGRWDDRTSAAVAGPPSPLKSPSPSPPVLVPANVVIIAVGADSPNRGCCHARRRTREPAAFHGHVEKECAGRAIDGRTPPLAAENRSSPPSPPACGSFPARLASHISITSEALHTPVGAQRQTRIGHRWEPAPSLLALVNRVVSRGGRASIRR